MVTREISACNGRDIRRCVGAAKGSVQEVLEGDGTEIDEGNGVGCIHEAKLEVSACFAAREEALGQIGTLALLACFVDSFGVDGL